MENALYSLTESISEELFGNLSDAGFQGITIGSSIFSEHALLSLQ
jgi:hypothetical protein